MTDSEKLLHIPADAGRAIVESGAMLSCPLLGRDQFANYCKERGMAVTSKRLLLLERLGRFAPVFRVKSPPGRARGFYIPVKEGNNWFEKGWAWDTTAFGWTHEVPKLNDERRQGYYSIFQIEHLSILLSQLTLSVELDWELEARKPFNWGRQAKLWKKVTEISPAGWRGYEFRRATGLLCQYISERYYPYTQGDQRKITLQRAHFVDRWIATLPDDDWRDYVRRWDPKTAERLFDLTPEKLAHAYRAISLTQSHADPLEHWHQLVQFVALNQRKRLKGDALFAETVRSGALMLRLLYKDLYGEELPHPNEIYVEIFKHIPELEVRRDTRRYLEFVANRFHVNPQPIAAIIVEGPTEQRAIELIYEHCFGSHPGRAGIEIIVLGGVDAATGAKEDRFRAILRLIDYLHHHQTITFLILDNERYARKLHAEARNAKSIHHTNRYVTRPEYIKVWRLSFEFDNYSNSEIAKALTLAASSNARLSAQEVEACRWDPEAGAALKRLYFQKAGKRLDKMHLAELLAEQLVSPRARKKLINRPIVKTLRNIERLASRNPLPTMQEYWERNQGSKYLGKRRAMKKAKAAKQPKAS